jgi:hypothetical protein
MTSHDLNTMPMARRCEADTSIHQPCVNASINVASADALAGAPSASRRRCAAGSLERTIPAAETPRGRTTNSLQRIPEGAA